MLIPGLIIMLAALIQGMTSFGFSLVALPLLTLVISIDVAVPMLVVYSVLLNLIILTRLYKNVNLSMIGLLVTGGICGIPLGIWVLRTIDPSTLKLMAGVFIVIVSVLMFLGYRAKLQNPKKWYPLVGLASGILQGSLSLSGPPVILFLTNQDVDKSTFRSNLTAHFTMLNIVSIPGFLISGVINSEVMSLSLSILPYMLVGLVGGMLVAERINDGLFKKLTLFLITISGVAAIITA